MPPDTFVFSRDPRTALTGFLTGSCVLFTSVDACMRDFTVVVPSDCCLDLNRDKHCRALAHMQGVLKAKVAASPRLTIRRAD